MKYKIVPVDEEAMRSETECAENAADAIAAVIHYASDDELIKELESRSYVVLDPLNGMRK